MICFTVNQDLWYDIRIYAYPFNLRPQVLKHAVSYIRDNLESTIASQLIYILSHNLHATWSYSMIYMRVLLQKSYHPCWNVSSIYIDRANESQNLTARCFLAFYLLMRILTCKSAIVYDYFIGTHRICHCDFYIREPHRILHPAMPLLKSSPCAR